MFTAMKPKADITAMKPKADIITFFINSLPKQHISKYKTAARDAIQAIICAATSIENIILSRKHNTAPAALVKPPTALVKPPTALVKPSAAPTALVKPNAAPTALVKPNAAPTALVKPNASNIYTNLTSAAGNIYTNLTSATHAACGSVEAGNIYTNLTSATHAVCGSVEACNKIREVTHYNRKLLKIINIIITKLYECKASKFNTYKQKKSIKVYLKTFKKLRSRQYLAFGILKI